MKQRFLILVDDASPDEQNAVTYFCRGRFAYWHQFSDAWLITASNENWTPKAVRDELKTIVRDKTILVMRIPAKAGWAGKGPTGTFDWLKSTWSDDAWALAG